MARAEMVIKKGKPTLVIHLKVGEGEKPQWLELQCRESNYKHGDMKQITQALGHAALAIEQYKPRKKRKKAA